MRFIIIGAGLGGLECGYLLSKQGHEVCVLEQGNQIGGCLQTFERHGQRFDTGFHYVGGLGEGEILHQLFSEFNLLNLPWQQLDTECFDEIFLNGEHFVFANGYENFAEKLAESFPAERPALLKYVSLLKSSQEGLADLGNMASSSVTGELLATSAFQYLNDLFPNEKLRNVLSATSLKMDLRADSLPLYIFSQINGTFIQSAWRLRGGGQQIADTLADGIRAHGGEVRTHARVTGFRSENERLTHVIINGEEEIPCALVVSDIHPNALFPLLPEGCLRKRYQQRISNLQNSFGVFTVQLLLKEGTVPYRNRNLFIHNRPQLWRNSGDSIVDGTHSIGVHFSVPKEGSKFTRNIDLFMPMDWSEVARWYGTQPMRRGEEYETFKQKMAEKSIQQVLPYIPEIQGNIEKIYTSTPLSYQNYTGTFEGSAYGICKDFSHLMTTMIPAKTPIPNLFLTGQNANFHGVLGVTVTAKMTCGQINESLPMLF